MGLKHCCRRKAMQRSPFYLSRCSLLSINSEDSGSIDFELVSRIHVSCIQSLQNTQSKGNLAIRPFNSPLPTPPFSVFGISSTST